MKEAITIHTFGDSHCGFKGCNWDNIHIEGIDIRTHWIGAKTCFSFGIKKLNTLDISKFDVKDGDIVCFSFGEIDVRVHINKIIVDWKLFIDYMGDRYFNAIKQNVSQFNLLGVMVSCVTPVAFGINDPEYPTRGTNEERREYTEYINSIINDQCVLNNYIYFDFYNDYCNKDGYLNMELSDGHVHIKNAKFMKQRLIDIIDRL